MSAREDRGIVIVIVIALRAWGLRTLALVEVLFAQAVWLGVGLLVWTY